MIFLLMCSSLSPRPPGHNQGYDLRRIGRFTNRRHLERQRLLPPGRPLVAIGAADDAGHASLSSGAAAMAARVVHIKRGCNLVAEAGEAVHRVAVARDQEAASLLEVAERAKAVVFEIKEPLGIVERRRPPDRREGLDARK